MHSDRHALLVALVLPWVLVCGACSDEAGGAEGGATDTGSDRTLEDRAPESPPDADDTTTSEGPDVSDAAPDLVPTENDSDGDGLPNVCEQETVGLDPNDPDSDGDGLLDGVEDANHNCTLDPGETDPARQDTDGDGISDSGEAVHGTSPFDSDTDDDGINDGSEIAFSLTNPLVADSDGDGCLDGVEDRDGNGRIGTCAPGAYAPACSEGETDPNAVDTDGDGIGDCDDTGFVACAPEGLRDPQLVRSEDGDLTLAVETDVTAGELGFPTRPTPLPAGLWFDDAAHDLAGFALAFEPAGGETDVRALAESVLDAVVALDSGATRRTTGRRTRTHDDFETMVGLLIEFPGTATPGELRRQLVAALGGVGGADLTLPSTASFASDGSGLLAAFSVVARGPGAAIVVGAVTTRDRYDDDALATGIRADDLTGGSALAGFAATLEPACVAYAVRGRPQVDFIWSIDGSGSMGTERELVAGFASDFGDILSRLDIDYRLGVIGGECSFIGGETDVSAEARALVAGADFDCTGSFPIIGGFLPGANGVLCNQAFTNSAATFATCVERMSEIGGEFTLSMGAVAIDRALPRQAGSARHLRPDAEVVLVVVTDEHEQSFEDILPWLSSATTGPSTPVEQAQLDALVGRYLSFLGRPDIEATVFGIYWVPGEDCPSGAEVAYGIHEVVVGTGGTAGSVCLEDITATLEEIAAASSGLASTFRLSGRPVALTLKVATAPPGAAAVLVPRSRIDGFDFDSPVNRVIFVGPAAPEAGDEVTISYRRWVGGSLGCTSDAECPVKFYCRSGECL